MPEEIEKSTKIDRVRHTKRIRNLIVICTLSAIVLIVATYAWFIGMQSVNVSSFEIEIAAADSLKLSLNGEDWSDTITFDKDNITDGKNSLAYVGNTNKWPSRGLFPVSSIGDMDSIASRMKLFEKASLTTTPGGYRLLASRVRNYIKDTTTSELAPEQDGYVAFDLFVKNFSGTQYIEDLNPLDEEAIYLTIDSAVDVALGGSSPGISFTGIENSVRVAFAQIGRVSGFNNTAKVITDITCSNTTDKPGLAKPEDYVTGICRTAQIWEPNDSKHVMSATNWYQTSCKPRVPTGEDVTKEESFDLSPTAKCNAIVDGISYPTYAISDDIKSIHNVDVYDGPMYNSYAPNIEHGKLVAYPYFRDTDKVKKGTQRPTFMTLSPNSITKIRIYVYIEGQDIDNYDFASVGKKIAVKFGFTKERLTTDDIDYNGPPLTPTL
ncbi:MAG: hypothetical protein RR557_01100 [Bacilli bacterium]